MIATGTRGGAGSKSEEAGLRNKVNGFGVLVLVAKKKRPESSIKSEEGWSQQNETVGCRRRGVNG